MKPLNNFTGYCLATFVPRDDNPDVSNVIGKRSGEWKVADGPLTIYPTVQGLIESIGTGYNKKTHLICEVLIHLSGERVEVVGV